MKPEIEYIQIPVAYRNNYYRIKASRLDHPLNLALHRSVTGKGWSITSIGCGRIVAKGNTMNEARGALHDVVKRIGLERVRIGIESSPPAPPVEGLEPAPPPSKPQRIDRNSIGQIVRAVADRAGLNELETDAVWRALATNGRNAGRLLSKPPSRYVDELANAAWNGLQPNPWKVQPTALLFADGAAKDLIDKLAKYAWPSYLDRDAATLKALNVW
jgi:hypothetical protein